MECNSHNKVAVGLCKSCASAVCNNCHKAENGKFFCNEACYKSSHDVDQMVEFNTELFLNSKMHLSKNKNYIDTQLKITRSNSGLWILSLILTLVLIINGSIEVKNYGVPILIIFVLSGLLTLNIYKYKSFVKLKKKC